MKKPATGADLYARFSRDGPPSELALNPPAEEPYRIPDLEEALSRKGENQPTLSNAPRQAGIGADLKARTNDLSSCLTLDANDRPPAQYVLFGADSGPSGSGIGGG